MTPLSSANTHHPTQEETTQNTEPGVYSHDQSSCDDGTATPEPTLGENVAVFKEMYSYCLVGVAQLILHPSR